MLSNPNFNPATMHSLASAAWIRSGLPLCLVGDSGIDPQVASSSARRAIHPPCESVVTIVTSNLVT